MRYLASRSLLTLDAFSGEAGASVKKRLGYRIAVVNVEKKLYKFSIITFMKYVQLKRLWKGSTIAEFL